MLKCESGGLSAEQWRNIQLDGLATSNYKHFLLEVSTVLRYQYPELNAIRKYTEDLGELHWYAHGSRMICCVDEANILMGEETDMFVDADGNMPPSRPLFYAVAGALSALKWLQLVFAGTHIGLKDQKIFKSGTMRKTKALNTGQVVRIITCFQ